MARKKHKPLRSVGTLENGSTSINGENSENPDANFEPKDEGYVQDAPFFVDIDRSNWDSLEHRDISEIVVTNLNVSQNFVGFDLIDEFYLRFRLCNVNEHVGRIKLGHWPVLSSEDVYLEFLQKRVVENIENIEAFDVVCCGQFDGTDEGVSGLVHLTSLKFLTLRLVSGFRLCEDVSSVRLRVEILDSAFDACESLLESTRQIWKKSMMSVMAWLRPEVTTSEARYGVHEPSQVEVVANGEVENGDQEHPTFDAHGFYEAIRRSKDCPMLDVELPDLIPELRPYQRRAAYWMVQRGKGSSENLSAWEQSLLFSPLCVGVDLLDSCSKMFYNPSSGTVSLCPEIPSSYVFGGILADEMGLGKTVELLACVFAHRKSSAGGSSCGNLSNNTPIENIPHKRVKRERIECICGALSESYRYKGLWVQCDVCDAWQHADCVHYSPSRTRKISERQEGNNTTRKKKSVDIVVVDDPFICQLCSELIQATGSPVDSGATLIVCPTPILPQWHAEILRHTNPGSLKTCIYEGVRDISLSNSSAIDVSQLANADIVLTTYDVLREDLSHDSERHEGDRRLMRYGKRYPVIPTLLTRVFWWRVCLDEAQMVESNVAAATEMAMRLHARHRWCITGTPIQRKLDDLYGLLRFLKASPIDVSRWWIEVVRDPYECRDVAAMGFAHKLFKQLMWRSSKSHVADELKLPPQEECVSWLSFSPVEEHFYQRQHETCVDFAREVLEKFRSNLENRENSGFLSSDPIITHLEAAKLLTSLLKLRQACCHPQVGGSGLRSLQRSPMTMDEILSVLISKTKIEGEDALRKVVSSLNGLAGIAIIRGELCQAALVYKEALALVEEHSEDFRLDPLLSLHIHHNLAEVLKSASTNSRQEQSCGNSEEKPYHTSIIKENDGHTMKKRKVEKENYMETAEDTDKPSELNGDHAVDGLKGGQECDTELHAPNVSSAERFISVCESIKQKYLSIYYAKLSQSQQEFQKSYMKVCDALSDKKNNNTVWWLEALQSIELNKEAAKELLQKIENTVIGNRDHAKSPRSASRFRSMNALKYYIQTGLDSLEASRKRLFDQLLKLDQTMDKPRAEDIDRVRYCPNCYVNVDGSLCTHCELDELFQAYEARIFLRRTTNSRKGLASEEEAVDLQRKKLDLNKFYWNISLKSNNSASSSVDVEESRSKRDALKMLIESKNPSELEIILGSIRSYFKKQLGREDVSAANRHLNVLEGMRKEYVHARSLATAQANVLRAYDEIKMATSRLRLKENDNDNSIDALSLEELDVASVENSSEKFLSLATLSQVRGKLRYLQGLVLSNQKTESDSKVAAPLGCPPAQGKVAEGVCPVCQESLEYQRMVFQCGHVTCCKCLFAITERSVEANGKLQDKWVMCPTCRQHSDFESIAFADDRQNKSSVQRCESVDAFVSVQGSYGTKIEAITRRILWIKSTDPKAKILVFSSWKDVLDVLQHAFAANEISYVRMKGGRKRSQAAISIFKGDTSTEKVCGKKNGESSEPKFIQVLLLLIQHGANGLNLLEAQHVILVEPLLNPAAEAQAISRVHRVGQTSKTLVHRFIVKDTVEESLYKLNKSRNSSSFISGNKKNQDQPILTVKDVESLFAVVPSKPQDNNEEQTESLTHLPPSVAAAIAAERRLSQCGST